MDSEENQRSRRLPDYSRAALPLAALDRRERAGFRRGWAAALLLTGLLVVLVSLPPFVSVPVRSVLMTVFSAVCHQLPARSPHVDGVALAVCHRCCGIYAGLLGAALAFPLVRRWDGFLGRHAGGVLVLALAVPGADWLAGLAGIWANTAGSRVLTGALFGVVAGYYLTRALVAAALPGPVPRPAGRIG